MTARGVMARHATVIALLAACAAACGGDLERMRAQPRADPYEATAAFANGAVLQAPPAGTVPRTPTRIPPPPLVTPALVAEGGERYAIFCAVCHGVSGFGGSVVAANMVGARPPSLRSGRAGALPPEMIHDVILRGVGRMPSYAQELTPRQRWAVVAYVIVMRDAPAIAPSAVEDSLRALGIRRVDSLRAARGETGAGARSPAGAAR